MMARLRSYRMFRWQPNDCDIIDNDYWIPHGQGLTRQYIMDTDSHRNRGPQDADLFTAGTPLAEDDIDTLYARNGAAGQGEKRCLGILLNVTNILLAFLKANVTAV